MRVDPPLVSALFASQSPVGVVLVRRRELVRMVLWDTSTDRLIPGQWMKGTVSVDDCELSPSGELLMYSASRRGRGEFTGRTYWSAVSKPPYWTALIFLPSPAVGCFESNSDLVLYSRSQAGLEDRAAECPLRVRVAWGGDVPSRPRGWHTISEGWHEDRVLPALPPEVRETISDEAYSVWAAETQKTLRREHPRVIGRQSGDLLLERQDRSWDISRKYKLRDTRKGVSKTISKAGWADFDPRGRLVFSRSRTLFTGSFDEVGGWEEQVLREFEDETFSKVAPPDWATRW